MNVAVLPEVDRLQRDWLEELPARWFWQVEGGHFAGKSTLLRRLAATAREEGYVAVLVQPPERAPDAGMAAMLDVARGLADGGVIGADDLAGVRDGRRLWADKLEDMERWLALEPDRVILFCDDPVRWSSGTGEDSDHFRRQVDEVIERLMAAPCRKVVTGKPCLARQRKDRRWALKAVSAGAPWLREGAAWGELAGVAEELAARNLPGLEERSALEVRLLVALAALRSPEEVARWWGAGRERRRLTGELIAALENTPEARALLEAWGRLSLVRRPLDEPMLEALEVPADWWGQLLRHCLLFEEQGAYRLHELLKADAREYGLWLEPAARREAHARLHRIYRERFEAREAGDGLALVEECEAFHHGMHSGDVALMDGARPFFAAQLDILGRTLSRDHENFEGAAGVFERALKWEPEDDYAHHYRAYNLDVLARDPGLVEIHYQRAIELEPDNVWWHSRWINYLITRGRMSAARGAWREALDQFELPDPDADPVLYGSLHIWVARLLLHRGQLDMAREVLDGIPEGEFRDDPGKAALKRRLVALVQARRGEAVFPLSIPVEQRWQGPHVAPARHGGHALLRWMPARVDAVSEEGVVLQAAEVPEDGQAEPGIGRLELTAEQFDAFSDDLAVNDLAAGRFLELAWYEGAEQPLIRVYPDEGWRDPDLPPLFPDPARYLRAAGWVA
ncbi:tetratricopeptide repeat protein [Thioalkalivibrio sp. ALgr3]|uniref:tetratricopeptide repeat protein n=1 Tax=Thioalkalivibrio sp. ALgr3 TaxID=1239292 RepID=UPI0003A1F87C|nr:tetratricopeptide repeat protein [Thioalkalivibrio sp. ALgr3]